MLSPSTRLGTAVLMQRTLEFMPLLELEVLLFVDSTLCACVALFLALRFNAWLTQITEHQALGATSTQERHEAWMITAARFLLNHAVTPPFPEAPADQCPPWLMVLMPGTTHVGHDESVAVEFPVDAHDVIHAWIVWALLGGAVDPSRQCCITYRRPKARPLHVVYCTEQSFYVALEKAHRTCMIVQALQGVAPRHIDLRHAPRATRLWLPGACGCQLANGAVLDPSFVVRMPSVTICGRLSTIDLTACTTLTAVGDNFAEDGRTLESVLLPSSVTTIGDRFCAGNRALQLLNLSTCTRLCGIGTSFAEGCRRLTSVLLPRTPEMRIGARYCAWNRRMLHIDASMCGAVETVEDFFASLCEQLTSVALPASVTTICSHVCSRNPSLVRIDLSACSALTVVGANFAERCTALTLVQLPPRVGVIGARFLAGCHALHRIDLSACRALTSVGDFFAEGCEQLATVVLPSSVTTIGTKYCSWNPSMQRIDLSPCTSLTSLGDYFAEGSTQLTSVVLPRSVTSMGSHFCAFNSAVLSRGNDHVMYSHDP